MRSFFFASIASLASSKALASNAFCLASVSFELGLGSWQQHVAGVVELVSLVLKRLLVPLLRRLALAQRTLSSFSSFVVDNLTSLRLSSADSSGERFLARALWLSGGINTIAGLRPGSAANGRPSGSTWRGLARSAKIILQSRRIKILVVQEIAKSGDSARKC